MNKCFSDIEIYKNGCDVLGVLWKVTFFFGNQRSQNLPIKHLMPNYCLLQTQFLYNIFWMILPAMTNYQVVQRVPQGYRMPRPPSCPKVMYDIMMDCWKESEQDRPTFETLQWKLEDFFDLDVTSYDDAGHY